MNRLLRRFIPKLNDHLSDDRLASLFSHELPFAERLIARCHLAKCRHCCDRQEDLEGRRADQVLELYRDALNSGDLSLSEKPRTAFAQRLELHIQNAPPRKWWAFRLPNISFPELPPMHPALATCLVFGLATAVSFLFWWQQRVPNITSNTLLVRAEKWDSLTTGQSSGVMYQAVRITMTKQTIRQTMERSIYRDLQGKRQPRHMKLASSEEQLRSTLTQAGLDWDAPLSAYGYQGWHDHQRVRADQIVRAGKHLLKLTTTVPDGSVSEQSLTVRDTDFHPVQRTIAFRDSGLVEIAEIDFKILPWSAVDVSAFEPIISVSPLAATTSARVLPFPRLPETVSADQLDETELGVRLILNQLHADTGEQIEIHRVPDRVEVVGLVETDERKHALQAQLRMVPHLSVSIQSVADLRDNPGGTTAVSNIRTASMPDQPSALESYLKARGLGVSAINVFAQRLFDNALTISQESNAIVDLQTRFVPGEQKTVLASATLTELIYSHRERLEAAMKREHELLNEVQNSGTTENEIFVPKASLRGSSSLTDAAVRNLALCKELTQTNSPAARSAETILAEMSATMQDLVSSAHETYEKQQGNSTLSGKK